MSSYKQHSNDEGWEFGKVELYVTHTDFEAAATSDTVAFASPIFPTNAIPYKASMQLTEVFAGGSISAATMQLGDAGDADALIAAGDVFTGSSLLAAETHGSGAESLGSAVMEAAYAPILTLTLTGDNCDALTTGELMATIYYMKHANG